MGAWMRRLSGLAMGLWGAASAQAFVIPPEPLLELGGGVEVVAGSWTATASQWNTGRGPATLVQLSLRTGRRGETRHSFARLLTDLSGLSPEIVLPGTRPARFQLVRDAGTLRFEGRFQAGAGTGDFTFLPNPRFMAALRGLGYPAIDADRAYTLAALDVARTFVEELGGLGYSGLPLEQLLAFRIHGVDAAFIRGLQTEGYANLPPDDLVALRMHGARPELLAELRRLGYPRLAADQIVRFRIHGVTPDFIRELQGLGYASVAPDDLVALRVHGVTAEFVKKVNAGRAGGTPVARIVDLRVRASAQ